MISEEIWQALQAQPVSHYIQASTRAPIKFADYYGFSNEQRFAMRLLTTFAALALVLAAIGIYGVLSYTVRQRVQEIGIRMALGASSASVFRMVLGQALYLVLTGIATGLLASAALTRLLAGLLFEVEPLDPTTFAATSLALLTIATVAAYIPARRSMRMAPIDALRTN